MFSGCCRVGDIVTGVCNASASGHPRNFTGFWTTGASDVTADGIGMIRVGDLGITDCGHTFQAVAGSSDVQTNNLGQVRIGDPVIVIQGGSGTAVSGASDVTSN
jgi:uncharacterized Zn-binding protein involved in type VI secretion